MTCPGPSMRCTWRHLKVAHDAVQAEEVGVDAQRLEDVDCGQEAGPSQAVPCATIIADFHGFNRLWPGPEALGYYPRPRGRTSPGHPAPLKLHAAV